MQTTPESPKAAAPSVLAMREALQEASDYLAEMYAKYQLKIGPFASQGQRINVKARAALAAQAGAATESSSERSSGCLNSSGLAQTLTSETTSPSVLAMREALQRIADMRDRDGNAIEMHREELRGIARAALAALPVPRAGERKAFLESLGLVDYGMADYRGFYIIKEREGDEHSAWLVVMPGGRTFAINGHADDAFDERLASWIRDTLNAALAASPIATPTRPTLTERLQQKCSDWKTYWRAPDAHGVNLSVEQATELLADALGVEVDIATPKPQERELHHTISTAAALSNWHAAISGTEMAMRPGIDPVAHGIVPQDGDRGEGEGS